MAPSCLAPWPPASAKDDAERYRRAYEAYEQFQGMTNQEAEVSGSGIKRTQTYILRDREEAEQRLLEDYFGNDDTPPKYPEENFRRRQRIDAIGRNNIDHILKITSAIRQLAYGTAPPDAFDEYLQRTWIERCDLHVRRSKELRDSLVYNELRHDLVNHLWNLDH
ncbi:hypothetical protein Tco_1084649 [Tanacetum coccineum]